MEQKHTKILEKYGVDACRIAWRMNRINGEGMTMCALESGIPRQSVSAAIDAYQAKFDVRFPPNDNNP